MLSLDVQYACAGSRPPDEDRIAEWVSAALGDRKADAELTIRIVDEAEGAELNHRWRHGAGTTNVLSFPASGLEKIAPGLLGDIVVCAPVVEREAHEQGKAVEAHWAHLIVHGTLHLLGYAHEKSEDADIMEALEADILKKLGFADPYESIAE